MNNSLDAHSGRVPWNKGKLIGQKLPLKQREIWRIRANLEHQHNVRELAMFDLPIDSKLRACDLTSLRVCDVMRGEQVFGRTVVLQAKTQRPVRFEITDITRQAVATWVKRSNLEADDFLFPSRCQTSAHLSTRQYARIVGKWVTSIHLDPSAYGAHTMRRTKPTLIYRRTGNLRAIQLLLGHTKIESTVRYPDALVREHLSLCR